MTQSRPRDQFRALRHDWQIVTHGHKSRWLTIPFSQGFLMVLTYRLNRAAYLAWGRRWSLFRGATAPLSPIVRLLVPNEIDYRAEIGGGLRILHPELGIVISADARIGERLILAGGNVIGDGAPHLGNNVELGVNAVVIGNVVLGDMVVVGAGAVVVKHFAGPGLLVGVPARPIPPDEGGRLRQ